MKRRKPYRSRDQQPVEDTSSDEPALDALPLSPEPDGTQAGAETDPDPSTETLPRLDDHDDRTVPRSRMRFLNRSKTPKGQTMSLARQTGSTLAIATAVALLGTTATGLAATTTASSPSAGPSAKAWCALVIQINTQYGAMKNKRYLPGNKVPLKSQKALISTAIAQRTQILAVTPTVIKKAMTDLLTYYARLKARGYSNPALTAPLTIAEAGKLLDYQHKYCGIT